MVGASRQEWRANRERSPAFMPGVFPSSWMAMLTTQVNIAVFAAFRFVVGGVLLSDAEFKRLCGPCERDIWCYGWQKRQDRGKKRQGGRQKRQGGRQPNPQPLPYEGR